MTISAKNASPKQGQQGAEMTKEQHRIATGLPSSWREVRSADGVLLHWRREHSGYEVYPQGALGRDGHVTRYRVELDGAAIGEPNDTLTHAIVAAREHMDEQLSKQLIDQARSEVLGG